MKAILIILFLSLKVSAQSWHYDVANSVQNYYRSRLVGQNLTIEFDLSKSTLAGSAEGNWLDMKVILDGGLLSWDRLTPDALRILICHEIGHHLGGAPYKYSMRNSFSTEGQSDYYATSICFPKTSNPDEKFDHSLVTESLRAECNSEMCLRAAVASLQFLNLVKDFEISFDTPDDYIETELRPNEYPSRQCRLDTLVAAGKCEERTGLMWDLVDGSKNDCSNKNSQRPRCWYPR